MLEKAKAKVYDRLEEKARIKREQQEREALLKAERLKAEREKLMNMSEKELLVEVILSLREHNSSLEELKKVSENIKSSVETIYSHLLSR